MSLYSPTDSAGNQTKAAIGVAASSQAKTIVHVNDDEAVLNENKSRGITSPGWWSYFTYTDAQGNTRHKAELLVTLANAGAEVVADDTIAADLPSAVSIDVQPASSTSGSGSGTFTLTTSTTGTPGALSYVWQRKKTSGAWKNIVADLDAGITYANFTTATLAYSGLGNNSLDGYSYRVKVTSAGGTEEVISDGAATLTFGS